MKNAKRTLSLLLSLLLVLGAAAIGISASAEYSLPGSGTEEDPYRISNYSALNWFAYDIVDCGQFSACAVLISDISSSKKDWVPIARNSDCAFTGTFDGGGHKITGLSNSGSSIKENVGLFGFIGESGTVMNVCLESADFTGKKIGGIAAVNNGTITNCRNTSDISGDFYVGGIAYENNGTITNCCNEGNISGNAYTGSIAGSNYGTITNCLSTGNVTGVVFTGGIAGLSTGTITSCYNEGNISKKMEYGSSIGGIAGGNIGKAESCCNTGNVSGSACVGGVAGDNYNGGKVTNCFNTGNISGKQYVGGVAGSVGTNNPAQVPTVRNCYSAGEVTLTVEEGKYAGGVVGCFEGGTVENCCYDKSVCGDIGAVNGADIEADNVKGLTTEEMTGTGALDNMPGFSSETWLTHENSDEYLFYPHLRGFDYDSEPTAENWLPKTEKSSTEPPAWVGTTGETTVKAVDCESEITTAYRESKKYDFEIENMPEGAIARIYINGEDKGEGTSIIVREPKDDYTVECKALDAGGNEIASSGEIKVTVKHSFFDKIKWFFGNIVMIIIKAVIGVFAKIL